jgi:hypothetical protein
VFHELGMGKTCTSVAVAEASMNERRRVFVLLPASLERNYLDEVQRCAVRFCLSRLSWIQEHNRWVGTHTSTESNFNTLTVEQQAQVRGTLEMMIRDCYTFIHYNGVRAGQLDRLTANGTTNPFDDSVVVIDEAHNLMSRVRNGGVPSGMLYDLILHCRRAKVLLLTGTPLINAADELALMINLVRGAVVQHCLTMSSPEGSRNLEHILRESPDVLEMTVQPGGGACVELVPEGFLNVRGQEPSLRRTPESVRQDPLDRVLKAIQAQAGGERPSVVTKISEYLPVAPEVFEERFVDTGSCVLTRREELARMLSGMVSFQDSDALKGRFPTVEETQELRIPMSSLQFGRYIVARRKELEMERSGLRRAAQRQRNDRGRQRGGEDSAGAFVRPFSREVCNFAFPEGMTRLYPNSLESEEKDAYSGHLAELLQELRGSDRLSMAQLAQCSPKLAAMIPRVQNSPGPVLVYSQFRVVEGIAIVALAMEANGFVRLTASDDGQDIQGLPVDPTDRAPRFFVLGAGSREADATLLALFNSDPAGLLSSKVDKPDNRHGELCRAVLITQSGAEGITLKCVREVHILEPYWHTVRMQQIIGRAARLDSHANLEESERLVRVFLYVSVATEEQFLGADIPDKHITSDEFVLEAARRKEQIVSQLLDLLRAASVDCRWRGRQPSECLEGIERHASEEKRRPTMRVTLGGRMYVIRPLKTISNKEGADVYDYERWMQGVVRATGNTDQGRRGHVEHPVGGPVMSL